MSGTPTARANCRSTNYAWSSRRSSPAVEVGVVAALLALAATLRSREHEAVYRCHSQPDEANIVLRADLVHGAGSTAGWYDYPSLLFLVLSPSQLGLDEPSYGAARVIAVALGVGGGRGVVARSRGVRGTRRCRRSGRRRGGDDPRGVPRMAVTDVLLTLAVTLTLALLVTGRLEWAGLPARVGEAPA